MLSAAVNQTKQESLHPQGSRLLANFNACMTFYIIVASYEVCEQALPDVNASQWYHKNIFRLFHARGLALEDCSAVLVPES